MILSMVLICANDPPACGFFCGSSPWWLRQLARRRDSILLWRASHIPRKKGVDVAEAFANPMFGKTGAKAEAADLPLAGEMSGRTGGAGTRPFS
ncbi:hypothetical protein CK215_29755 [Mesorhizobium sp. WSM3864]|nr:hypothetical protein CK215_29755 [Mesorhizobium sp. WSM3864]